MTKEEYGEMRLWLMHFMFIQYYPMFQIEETGDFYDGIHDAVWDAYSNFYKGEWEKSKGV